MFRLRNRTLFACEGVLQVDREGREIWVVIVKGTFLLREGRCEPAEDQEPVHLADVFIGEPGRSSIRYASELAFDKSATDIVVNGHAWAPQGGTITELDVEVRLSTIHKRVRVFGERVWERSLVGITPSTPQPFEKIPLVYERAFGGTDTDGELAETRNPIGCGFALSTRTLVGRPVPNLEDPEDLIRSAKSRPRPAGLGFVAPHWNPRQNFAGTYDQHWADERAPLWPADFDTRFFQAAPTDQIVSPALQGGELVELRHLNPTGWLEFHLPRTRLGFRTCIGGEWIAHRARLGSVIVEPDIPRVLMVWQTAIPCHRRRFALSATVITDKPFVPKGGTA